MVRRFFRGRQKIQGIVMPLKHVIFTSREAAEEKAGWSNWAVISISEPDCYPANLKEGWRGILRLEFHDIDRHEEPYVLFSEQQARDIISFVSRCQAGEAKGIVVHCKAGISRSAAVAKWIADRYGLTFPEGYSLYNKHVYRVLRDEHLLVGFGTDEG